MKLPSLRIQIVIACIVLFLISVAIYYSQRGLQSPFPERNVNAPDNPVSVADTEEINFIANNELPIITDDVDIYYSKVLHKFYVYRKTNKADSVLKSFFSYNNIRADKDDILYVNTSDIYSRLVADEYLFDPSVPNPETTDLHEHTSDIPLSRAELARLELLKEQLPFSTQNFAVAYSPILDLYFYQSISTNNLTAFESFFQSYGLLNTVRSRQDIFIPTLENPQSVVQKLEKLNSQIKTAPTEEEKSKYRVEMNKYIYIQ